ncbi:Josephin family protein [Theileria parva strain Muguga]|uniref:Josephin family protein n=1 Tax=Theileria parva strain Muguga TaxID=333668 RepID=UPI001C6243CA|nr:Josephin family protein [Theileria parva strain Muguga]KAF5153601.1 Josephin family protein [Theileria parva strain Muguga]
MDSHVYWELQPLGETTCGLHALNCIFQGPEFRLAELQSLSKECGKLERDFLSQAGVSEVECETMALSETTGNFDFMVLEKALEKKEFVCTRLHVDSITEGLLDHKHAFLLNIKSHWVSARNIHDKWLLFDSKKEKPIELVLLEFLRESLAGKHTAFLVKEKSGKRLPVFNHNKDFLTPNQKFEPLNFTVE